MRLVLLINCLCARFLGVVLKRGCFMWRRIAFQVVVGASSSCGGGFFRLISLIHLLDCLYYYLDHYYWPNSTYHPLNHPTPTNPLGQHRFYTQDTLASYHPCAFSSNYFTSHYFYSLFYCYCQYFFDWLCLFVTVPTIQKTKIDRVNFTVVNIVTTIIISSNTSVK